MITVRAFNRATPAPARLKTPHQRGTTTILEFTTGPDLIVVSVSNYPAAVLLRVDGFSLATLHGVDQGYAPAAQEASKGVGGEGVYGVSVGGAPCVRGSSSKPNLFDAAKCIPL